MPNDIRIWRPHHEDRALLIAGKTTRYAIEPRGEYVFGVVTREPMRARRGRETHLVRPGELVAWDPSSAHSGSALDGNAWSSRLMLVEGGDLQTLISDAETQALADVSFPDPVVVDPELVAAFLRLHVALETSSTRLEQEERLSLWLGLLIDRAAARRPRQTPSDPHDERAVRLASDYLQDHLTANVGLDELARTAGIGKFRLVRLFRKQTGLPPHAYQVAGRLRRARRMLEAGQSVAHTAAAVGFADQSHLHRHFKRGIGMTPGQYQRRFVADSR